MTPLLNTQRLNVSIGTVDVCRNLNFSVLPGQCWGILGVNGVGKTTLLHTLAGLRPADSGEINIGNRAISQWSKGTLAKRLGVLFQDVNDPFPSTVLETALIGRHPYSRPWQWENAEDLRCAFDALRDVGLQDLQARQVQTLSGGERQRLALATLLTQSPSLYLLDEPNNHLDLQYQHSMLRLVRSRTEIQACAAIMVLHDINLAARYCDQVLMVSGNGETRAGSAESLLNEQELTALYGYPIEKLDSRHGPVFVPQ